MILHTFVAVDENTETNRPNQIVLSTKLVRTNTTKTEVPNIDEMDYNNTKEIQFFERNIAEIIHGQ